MTRLGATRPSEITAHGEVRQFTSSAKISKRSALAIAKTALDILGSLSCGCENDTGETGRMAACATSCKNRLVRHARINPCLQNASQFTRPELNQNARETWRHIGKSPMQAKGNRKAVTRGADRARADVI